MSYARKRKIDYTCVFRICQALICIFCILFCTLCAPCATQQHLNDAGVPRIRVEIHRPRLLAFRLHLGLYLRHLCADLLRLMVEVAHLHHQLRSVVPCGLPQQIPQSGGAGDMHNARHLSRR